MSISEFNKLRLQQSVASRPEVLDHLVLIDSCVDQTELRGNTQGVIELLEYRRETMLTCSDPDQFSDSEHRKLLGRIQSLAAKLNEDLKQAERDAETARRNSIPLLIETHPIQRGTRKKSARR